MTPPKRARMPGRVRPIPEAIWLAFHSTGAIASETKPLSNDRLPWREYRLVPLKKGKRRG